MSKMPPYFLWRIEYEVELGDAQQWGDSLIAIREPTGITQIREHYQNTKTGEIETLEWWTREAFWRVPHLDEALRRLQGLTPWSPWWSGQFV